MKHYLIADFDALTVDGETILVPSDEQWLNLFQGSLVENQPLFAIKGVKFDYELVKHLGEFRAGLRQLTRGGIWTVIFLFSSNRISNQRVHLERLTCDHCKAEVWSANHLVYDLYFKTLPKNEAYDRAKALPEVGCPVCHATLPRPSIFAFVRNVSSESSNR